MPGFMAAMARFPERKLAVVCLANNSSIQPRAIAERIADLYLFGGPASAPKEKKPQQTKEVRLSAAQIRDKVGVWQSNYRFVFRVVLENGRLYFVHHSGKKYQLKPLSESRFEPIGYPAPGNVLDFERTAGRRSNVLSLTWPGGKETYKPITLFQPTAKQLETYAGKFFSDEIRVTYRFRVRESKLWLQVNSRAWEPLEPTVRDDFIPLTRRTYDNRRFHFRRNSDGRIVSVEVSLWRVADVVFAKQTTR
jgi:hypothetical protein